VSILITVGGARARRAAALEYLDDDHSAAAARAWTAGWKWEIVRTFLRILIVFLVFYGAVAAGVIAWNGWRP
jgi:hypothetical protein